LKLQPFGQEFGGQSLLFAAKSSAVFAGSVWGLENVTVDELLLMAAVPDSGAPVR
jgi:hypothetical protein